MNKEIFLICVLPLLLISNDVFAQKKLLGAIEKGDIKRVEKLVEKGRYIDGKENEVTPLILATSKGNVEIVKILIDAGVDLNIRGYTSKEQKPGEVKPMMLSTEESIRWYGARTALMYAIELGYDEIAYEIILAGADPNVGDDWHLYSVGFRPLHAAVRNGNTDMIQLLIGNGADPNASARCWDLSKGFMIGSSGFAKPLGDVRKASTKDSPKSSSAQTQYWILDSERNRIPLESLPEPPKQELLILSPIELAERLERPDLVELMKSSSAK